jgi:urease accessory protein
MMNGSMSRKIVAGAGALLVAMAQQASAHTGVGDTSGFAHGMMHPVTGLDHVLAMITVGLFAARLGGRALWLVPGSFVAMMSLGGMLGMYGIPVPFIEAGIALSVVTLGTLVAFQVGLPVALAMALVGVFAIFHGHAHGTEMPMDVAGLDYGAGFVMATALLHSIGVGLGLALGRLSRGPARRVSQIGGAGVAFAGLALLFGAI